MRSWRPHCRGKFLEAAIIGSLLLFNVTPGFIHEGRARAALAALKRCLAPTALVRRNGEWTRLAAEVLVPGDVIRLPLGALVPADARILSGTLMEPLPWRLVAAVLAAAAGFALILDRLKLLVMSGFKLD